jgi:molybdopterin/thiamine biosynthesis adenylyltransferase
MTEINYHRQLDIFNPAEQENIKIHIIGCGGIGSFLAYDLAMLGLAENLVLWDNDTVEDHNIPNQNFLIEHIGMSKCAALADFINRKTGVKPKIKERFFTEDSHILDGIVVLCTDNIDSRKLVYNDVKDRENVKAIIDGRLGGESFVIYTTVLDSTIERESYEQTFFDASETAELPCTAKAIIYVGAYIGALMTKQVKDVICGESHVHKIQIDIKNRVIMYNDHFVMY